MDTIKDIGVDKNQKHILYFGNIKKFEESIVFMCMLVSPIMFGIVPAGFFNNPIQGSDR